MAGKDKKPDIRLSGFTDAWRQLKLGELLSEVKRPIRMKDEEEYQLVTVKRRNEGIVSRGFFKGKDILVKSYFELRSGDYLISKRQVVHGANGIVPDNLDGAIVSNEYLTATGNKSITSEFLSVISKLPHMYKLFLVSSYGVDIEKLVFDVEDWKKREISIPSVEEQNKITHFFNILDNTIILHQRKYNKLVMTKKSMLEKMFPKDASNVPEIRFAGFTDSWEKRKLSELVTPVVREVPKPTEPYEKISVRSHAKGTFHQKVENPDAVAMNKLFVVRENDLIVNITFAWEHAIAVAAKEDDGLLVSHRFPTYTMSNSDVGFMKYVVSQENFRRKMELISPGGAGRNRVLDKKDFLNIEVIVPIEIDEQNRIGVFFKNLDNLITLHQRKLDKLKNIKKAMLEKMFV